MSSSLLPDLGRGNLTVRKIMGCWSESKKVDTTSNFIGGQVSTRTLDSNGNVVVSLCGDGNVVDGIFYGHRTIYFYQPISLEPVTFVAGAAGMTQNLDHANVKTGSGIVTNATKTVTYTVTVDYTLNLTNGTITRTSTGAIAATDTVYVSYLYQDPNQSGMDSTIGSNAVSVIKGIGSVGTLIYDTAHVINLNDNLKCDANGLLSTAAGLTGSTIGIVTKPPTSEDPELVFDKII